MMSESLMIGAQALELLPKPACECTRRSCTRDCYQKWEAWNKQQAAIKEMAEKALQQQQGSSNPL